MAQEALWGETEEGSETLVSGGRGSPTGQDKKMKVETDNITDFVSGVFTLFATPAIAMLAWGAFIEITGLDLPKFGYWAFFMLNLVAGIFRTYIPHRWKVK